MTASDAIGAPSSETDRPLRGADPASWPRPRVRDDFALMDGYHSAQVSVEVRLNTNEAPEPPPMAFRDALAAELSRVEWHRYPDRAATALRAGLAEQYGLSIEHVFAANGSNEVLQSILLAYGGPGRSAAVFEPTYALHAHIARITGTRVIEADRAADFSLDLGVVRDVIATHHPEIVFLCSPNNPTGMVESRATLETLVSLVGPYGGLVVVDEAYGQFAPWSASELIGDDLPIVVSRTFSKTWSMAAARLGYCLAPSWLVTALDDVVLPYHLDVVKQIAGRLALNYRDEMDDRVRRLVRERERLVAGLESLPVTVWPSGANFVLFRPDHRAGDDVWRALVDRSVLVRNCASWPRLEGCLRVTIGTPDEDDRFLAALREVLS
jgi:histidinol-phosphate aminotransferase